MDRSTRTLSRWLVAGVAMFLFHGAAYAQATRTWVSGVGDDVNPCSRTAPCKTFAGAISRTAAGGEISVLDPGGYGTVNITKAITINGAGTHASILNACTNGVIVNAGANDVVTLRNLSIQGSGEVDGLPCPGMNGIKFLNGAALHLENVDIRAQNAASPNGYGVWINPTLAGNFQIFMDNVTIADCGNNTTGGAVYLQPMNPATATLRITNSQFANNQGFAGLRVDSGGFASLRNSSITGSWQHGALVVSSANPADLAVNDSLISGNGVSAASNGAGLQSQGTVASIRVSGTEVTDNDHGLRAQSSGILVSYGNNMVFGNTVDGAATSTITGF